MPAIAGKSNKYAAASPTCVSFDWNGQKYENPSNNVSTIVAVISPLIDAVMMGCQRGARPMAETVDGMHSHARNSTPNDSLEGPEANAMFKHATCAAVANASKIKHDTPIIVATHVFEAERSQSPGWRE